MKNILIASLLLFSICINAQSSFKKAKIYLKDGTIKRGFAKAKQDLKIQFKANKKDDAQILSYIEVDRYVIDNIEYDYKIINNNSKIQVFRVKQRGKVSLYYQINTSQNSPIMGINSGLSFSTSDSSEIYYIAENDNDKLTYFKSSKKAFKKIVPKFFGDCPDLLDKIDYKEYTKRDIVEIVNFYNYRCN